VEELKEEQQERKEILNIPKQKKAKKIYASEKTVVKEINVSYQKKGKKKKGMKKRRYFGSYQGTQASGQPRWVHELSA